MDTESDTESEISIDDFEIQPSEPIFQTVEETASMNNQTPQEEIVDIVNTQEGNQNRTKNQPVQIHKNKFFKTVV